MINPGLYKLMWGPWSYGSWIYNYQCNQCLPPQMLWVRIISIRAMYTTLCDKVCQWLTTGPWFSPGPPVSSTNKTDRHDITEILLKVALNYITNPQISKFFFAIVNYTIRLRSCGNYSAINTFDLLPIIYVKMYI